MSYFKSSQQPFARFGRAATQSIPNTTFTVVTWDTSINNNGISTTGSTTGFSFPINNLITQPGVWEISANVSFAANAAGIRLIDIYDSTNAVAYAQILKNTTPAGFTCELSTTFRDYFASTTRNMQVRVYQSSGGALNIGSGGTAFNFVTARRIGDY